MKLPKIHPMDIVEIIWVDIVSDSRWHPKDTVEKVKAAPCMYVGYVVNKDKDCLRCRNTIAFMDEESDYTVFPLGVIKKLTVLKRRKNGS
jgi:hypothetical protein